MAAAGEGGTQPKKARITMADLLDQFLLDLQARGIILDDSIVLGQTDDLAISGRQDADVSLALD